MDSFDAKMNHNNTYWWITSLAMSVVCCSVLFIWFSNYIYQLKEDLAIAQVRFEVAESRINEMSLDLQMLNRKSTVQQIQIIPPNGTVQMPPPASGTAPPGAAAEPASPAAAAIAVQPPPVTAPALAPAQMPAPAAMPAPAKH